MTRGGEERGRGSERRRRAYRLGLSAEMRAAWYLRLKGYRILAQRYKTPFGEIDIVARKRSILVFVEVKARSTEDEAIAAVGAKSRRRIEAAAQSWSARFPFYRDFDWRYDVIAVMPGRWPTHFMGAFRSGE